MGCIICFDDNVEIAFRCQNHQCAYEMCRDCHQKVFEDASGADVRECPSCKTPSARSMLKALCGPSAIRHIEDKLRSKVEYDVELEKQRKERGMTGMTGHKERANELFTALSDLLCMRCPRCQFVFHDYDGCNALKCGNPKCNAGFCAVCLKDCRSDTHSHVRLNHGSLFDKQAFEKARKEREAGTLADFLSAIADEPLEVRELVKISYEKLQGRSTTGTKNDNLTRDFLQETKVMLRNAVKADRCSLLTDGPGIRSFQRDNISPRNVIPDKYRLTLTSSITCSSICTIRLMGVRGASWVDLGLPNGSDDVGDERVPDSLINVKAALQCGVIAFEGSRRLYQTKSVRHSKKGYKMQDNEISIQLTTIDGTGDLVGEAMSIDGLGLSQRSIIGLNQNHRMVLLENHAMILNTFSLSPAIKHYIGDGTPVRLLDEITSVPPRSFSELNRQQQQVAHPLNLLSAKEVAGPPGTGKTKTITEVIRGILECTKFDVIILSERNGAIDAIAQKIASDCLRMNDDSADYSVTNIKLWSKVLAFGSATSMGTFTQNFVPTVKIR
jgi:AAA domain